MEHISISRRLHSRCLYRRAFVLDLQAKDMQRVLPKDHDFDAHHLHMPLPRFIRPCSELVFGVLQIALHWIIRCRELLFCRLEQHS